MKKRIVVRPLLLILVISLVSFTKKGSQCDSEALYQQTLKKLTDYSLLKDYRVYLKGSKKNMPVAVSYFPMTLNRGVKYKFFSAESKEYEGKLIVTLYAVNNGRPDFMFATNYMRETDKTYESIEFQVENTMNCLVGFSFKDGKEGCGVGISSFLKD